VGAFIGKVTELRPAPSESQEDTRSLRYGVFMAAPLLESGPGYVETKFSGNDDISENTDVIGRVMDAFTHHVLADSRGTILPVDLQGDVSQMIYDMWILLIALQGLSHQIAVQYAYLILRLTRQLLQVC